jgi:ribose transport system substrate-binding protein
MIYTLKTLYQFLGGSSMKRNGLGFVCGLLVLATALYAGGQGQKSGSGGGEAISVGVVMRTMATPYYSFLADGIRKACEANGWKVSVLDSNLDADREVRNMDTLITQRVNMIFLDAILSDPIIPSINRAAEAGIGVICVDTAGGEGAKIVTTVYSDNKENGRMVGFAYGGKLGKDSEIIAIMLSGNKGSVAGEERRTGLFAGIIQSRLGLSPQDAWNAGVAFNRDLTNAGRAENAAAKFRVVGQGWGNWSRDEGLPAAEDLITANKNVTVILGENDDMLLGALVALQNAGLADKVDLVAAADGAKAAYDLIRQPGSRYFATGENSPAKVGMKAVEIAKEILAGGKDMWGYPAVTLTDAFAVTAQNVNEHYEFGF